MKAEKTPHRAVSEEVKPPFPVREPELYRKAVEEEKKIREKRNPPKEIFEEDRRRRFPPEAAEELRREREDLKKLLNEN
jgi:hypothetical protein